MELLAGRELDAALAVSLYGETKSRLVAYSTSETAASRLLSALRRNFEIDARIERSGDLWYCRLTGATGTIATGTGDTRPLAVARAALNANPKVLHPPLEATRFDHAVPVSDEPAFGASCSTCGRPARARTSAAPLCNVCRWNRTNRRMSRFGQERPATNAR